MSINETFLAGAKLILGKKGWRDDIEALRTVATPWRGGYQGETAFIARPDTPQTLAALVRLCAEHSVAITPQGGNTGLVDGGIPHGEIVVKFDRMRAVRALDLGSASLTVESGMTLTAVQDIADNAGLYFPLSLASEGEATVGGLISTNAGGTAVLRYGMMRDLLLGVEAVMPDGTILNDLSDLRKNNTGYALRHLLAGAEGTLGLVTAASLRLFPKTACQTLWLSCASPEAVIRCFTGLRAAMGDSITAFELIDGQACTLALEDQTGLRDPFAGAEETLRVLVEISGPVGLDPSPVLDGFLEKALEQSLISDAVRAKNMNEAQNFWAIREGVSVAKRTLCRSVNHDIAVPISAISEFIALAGATLTQKFPGCFTVVFGHIGDGNLHYSLCQRRSEKTDVITGNEKAISSCVYEIVRKFGGSVSAEHGVGRLKRDLLWQIRDKTASNTMLAIKRAIDPQGLFNPRRVI